MLNEFEFYDAVVFDAKEIRRTSDGYLVANPRVGRTGIQLYRGREMNRADMETVRVWRPEEEVMSKDAMASLAYKPVTNDHPPEAVTDKNWKKYAVGQMGGEVARDGEYIRVPTVLMDATAIDDVTNGKRELSLGYTSQIEWKAGATPQGDQYDAIQRNIRINHLAVVDAARGGPKLAIGDVRPIGTTRASPDDNQATEDKDMPTEVAKLRTVSIDGIDVEMSDIAASVVARRLKALSEESTDLATKYAKSQEQAKKDQADSAASITKLTADLAASNAKVVTLESQLKDAVLTPLKLDQLVKDRGDVIAKAAAVLKDKLVVDGKTESEIRRQVVDAKVGEAAKGWADELVKASFETLTADVKVDSAKQIQQHFSGPPRVAMNSNDSRIAAVKAYDKRIGDAWKGPQAAGTA